MTTWWSNLSLRWKLALPLIFVTVVNCAAVLFAYTSNNTLGEHTKRIGTVYLKATDLVLQADRDLYQAQVAERSMLLTKPGSDQFKALNKFRKENIQQAHDRVARFAKLISGPKADSELAGWRKDLPAWTSLSQSVVDALESNTGAGRHKAQEISFGNGDNVFQRTRDHLNTLTEVVENRAGKIVSGTDATSTRNGGILLAAAFVSTFLCVLIAVLFPLLITKPLGRMVARMDDLNGGNGDLTLRLKVERGDELGQLATRFDRFLDTLQQIVSHIKDNVDQLASAAEQLTATSTQSQTAADAQKTAADQVSVASNELTATIQEVTRNVTHAAESASEADREAGNVKTAMSTTLRTVQTLADEVESAAGRVQELETEAENIGGVLDVIRGVAEQTNLLALNAAIEAARAGEQGRGFAVVADEVRMLASRTRQSTDEIREMIERLQNGSRESAVAMSKGRDKARETVTQAQDAGVQLDSVVGKIGAISDMNMQIASAAEQQSQTVEEINRNILDISERSAHGAEASREVAAASDGLSRLAAELNGLVDRFRV